MSTTKEAFNELMLHFGNLPNPDKAIAMVRELLAERDEAREDAAHTAINLTEDILRADAAGYAWGVRDAAAICRQQADSEYSAPKDLRSGYRCERLILALLPADAKEGTP